MRHSLPSLRLALVGLACVLFASAQVIETGPIESIEAISAEAAKGQRVTGRVVDSKDRPLAGAQVILESCDRQTLPFQISVEQLHAITDSQGRFEISGYGQGDFRLEVRLGGYVPLERVHLGLSRNSLVAPFDELVLMEATSLKGRVVTPEGGPVVGARLHVVALPEHTAYWAPRSLDGFDELAAVSDASGLFHIADMVPGPWMLRVERADYRPFFFRGYTEACGVEASELLLELPGGVPIGGQLVGFPAEKLEGLFVRARPKHTASPGDQPMGWREGTVRADGAFSIMGCEEGVEYELHTPQPKGNRFGFGEEQSQSVATKAFAGQKDVVLKWRKRAGVRFRVVDENGAPLEDFKVFSGGKSRECLFADGEPVSHHPDGKVALSDVRLGLFDLGTLFHVRVQAIGFEDFEHVIEIPIGKVVDLGTFQLIPVPTLTVRVRAQESGEPVAGVWIHLGVSGKSGWPAESFSLRGKSLFSDGRARVAVTNEAGVAHLSLYPGEVGVLRAGGPAAFFSWGDQEEIDFVYSPYTEENFAMPDAGNMEKEIVLSRAGSAVVTVLDALGLPLVGVEVQRLKIPPQGWESCTPRMSMDQVMVTDEAGRAVFESLDPGGHSFTLSRVGDPEGPRWGTAWVVGGEQYSVVMMDESRSVVSGVVQQLERPLAGALVELSLPPSEFRFSALQTPYDGLSTMTDGWGRFELTGVMPGSYRIKVSHPDRAMVHWQAVEVIGPSELKIDLAASAVTGRVIDSTGQPLPGIRMEALSSSEDAGTVLSAEERTRYQVVDIGRIGSDPSVTDVEGRYTLRGVTTDQVIWIRGSGPKGGLVESGLLSVAAGELKTAVDLVLGLPGG